MRLVMLQLELSANTTDTAAPLEMIKTADSANFGQRTAEQEGARFQETARHQGGNEPCQSCVRHKNSEPEPPVRWNLSHTLHPGNVLIVVVVQRCICNNSSLSFTSDSTNGRYLRPSRARKAGRRPWKQVPSL